jgi:hypothetical protein
MTMSFSATALRTWHANISSFIAPMVFFYALSGSLQIFDLHESHGSYHAPAIVTAIGRLHKNQVFAPPAPRNRPAGAAAGRVGGGPGGPPPNERVSLATLMLKWLFFVEALGLAATTIFGVWIGLTHAKRKRTVVALLVAGTVLPLALIALGRASG